MTEDTNQTVKDSGEDAVTTMTEETIEAAKQEHKEEIKKEIKQEIKQEVKQEVQQAVPAKDITPEVLTNKMDILADLNVTLTVEVGKAKIKIRDLLELRKDSIVELDKAAGDPVEIYANGKLISKGVIIVVNGKYCIKLTSVISDSSEGAQNGN